jgi:hypothetical protein
MFRYKASLLRDIDKDTLPMFDAKSESTFHKETNHMLNEVFDDFLRDYRPYMTSE